ncbi:MAG TPA: aspartate kinase [Candidatus Avamphibacillus intestinigallinarum]|nr:aspartate kinase [Candidatus Avamphibacillus intestinigallinarum]
MQILVQKFGGTSVQSEENRQHVIRHIKAALREEYKLVVVVSALGRKPDPYATDSLLNLIQYPEQHNSAQETDLLLSCGEIISSVVLSNELQRDHVNSVAITGSLAGILTNNDFTQAKILEVKPDRILEALQTHDVVVVAGFQGQTEDGHVTTLGRGGSDTSAAALGIALEANCVDIFTDVSGIMTADPRMVDKARALDIVSYSEICNMAYQGAKVIHPRAVEIAMQGKIPLRIRSTYTEEPGTLVTDAKPNAFDTDIIDRPITGIAHIAGLTQIKIALSEDATNQQSQIFDAMAKADVSVDFINSSPTKLAFTIPGHITADAVNILKSLGFKPEITKDCAKISAIGGGMTGVPGVAAKIVQALSKAGVEILQTADSHTTIWVLTTEEDMRKAVNALHEAFELNK